MSLSTTSKCFLSVSRDGDSITSLGSLFQPLTSLLNFFFFSFPNIQPIIGQGGSPITNNEKQCGLSLAHCVIALVESVLPVLFPPKIETDQFIMLI